jgi:predicted ATPase
MAVLRRVELNGFRSISKLELDLRPLNVMIGANGAGKSNLISFFRMLNAMMGKGNDAGLQNYVAHNGRAHSLLHYGPKATPQMEAALQFETDNAKDEYRMRLFYAAGDTLVFAEEVLRYLRKDWQGAPPQPHSLGAGHLETRIAEAAESGDKIAQVFRQLLNNCRVYHFHDTSATAKILQYCYVGADRFLMPDAGNLAAVLYRFRERETGPAYRRIVGTIRQIAPFFGDFELEPEGRDIILNWREKDSDQVFGPHQLSDGTLRSMALFTLLLQPIDNFPDLIIIDEPELGLHPAAKNLLAGMLKSASQHCQIIVATQSPELVDAFDPEDVVVVEREERQSVFCRLDPAALGEWLKEYTLGQLWEKNVFGGGPFR